MDELLALSSPHAVSTTRLASRIERANMMTIYPL
jgi:hypothetical protein